MKIENISLSIDKVNANVCFILAYNFILKPRTAAIVMPTKLIPTAKCVANHIPWQHLNNTMPILFRDKIQQTAI